MNKKLTVGYYPGWDSGFVLSYIDELYADGQRKKAAAKLEYDLAVLQSSWPRPVFVTVKPLKGYEPLWELKREFHGIAYRIFFCVKEEEVWLLHSIEKKSQKTPVEDLKTAFNRMQKVLRGTVYKNKEN